MLHLQYNCKIRTVTLMEIFTWKSYFTSNILINIKHLLIVQVHFYNIKVVKLLFWNDWKGCKKNISFGTGKSLSMFNLVSYYDTVDETLSKKSVGTKLYLCSVHPVEAKHLKGIKSVCDGWQRTTSRWMPQSLSNFMLVLGPK